MPSAYALGIVSRNSILDFGVAGRRRAGRENILKWGGGVVKSRFSARRVYKK